LDTPLPTTPAAIGTIPVDSTRAGAAPDAGRVPVPGSGRPSSPVLNDPGSAEPAVVARRHFATIAGLCLATLGALVLLGWAFDIGSLKSVLAGRPTMKINAALCLTLLGVALVAQARGAAVTGRLCAAAVVLFSFLHLWEHAAGADLGIDDMLVRESLADGGGRMAMITAIALNGLGIALCLDRTRDPAIAWLRDGCAVIAALIGLGGMAGHLYDFQPLRILGPLVATIAVHTSVALGLAGVATLALAPASPLARIVFADRAGGRLARALLPVAIVLPLAAGWLRLLADDAGLLDIEVSVLWVVMSSIVGFSGATLLGAAWLNAADDRLLATNLALERRVAERTRELQEAARRLEAQSKFARGVLDSLTAGVAVLDADGIVVEVNGAWRHLAHLATADPATLLTGTDYLAACEQGNGRTGSHGAADAVAGIRSVMRGECDAFTLEYVSDAPGRGVSWSQLRATPLAGSAGRVVVTHQDITARKRLEMELASSEELLRVTGNMARAGGWELDLATLRIRWTEAVYRIHEFDAPVEPALEQAIAFYAPEARPVIAAAVQAGIQDGRSWDLELPFVTATGRRLWVKTTGEAVREGGRTVRLHGTFQDVTERRRAEEALREREASYRIMFEANAHPMFVYDPADLAIIAVNDAAVERYGWSREEFLTLTLGALHQPAELERVRATVKNLGPGFTTGIAWQHRTRAGETIEVEVSSHTVQFEGHDGRLVLVHEVTERNRIERELRAKNTELERFAYTVSHDLKSPLVTVRTFAGYLHEDLAAGDTAKITADLGYITHAADRMGRLLDELLKLSRVGQTRDLPVRTSYREIAEEALRLTAGAVSRARAQVDLDEQDVPLYGDRTRLIEIWQNLIDNAAKFMGPQPAPRIRMGSRTAEGETEFFVQDNGVGIDPRHGERVFGLFDKLDPASGGTGIGLALVRRIVELYGGRIRVESEGQGLGSCFAFTLPDAARPPQ
jgi:PAS domain S-box-containing protein